MKQTKQMSESMRLGILLAISGGFMDAYSYMMRDHGIWQMAQTGNMLLFGVYLSEGKFPTALHYFLPVLAFAHWGLRLQNMCGQNIHRFCHWRQFAVLIEALILVAVGFFPLTMNLLAKH